MVIQLGQLERRRLLDVLVGAIDQSPDAHERRLQVVQLVVFACLGDPFFGVGSQFVGRRLERAASVAVEHRERAVDEVAQAVGQLGGVAGLKTFVGPVAVRADVQLTHDVVAERIDTPLVDHRDGIHHVAGGLAHFLAVLLPPTVHEHLTRQRKSHRLEHDRPIDGVELENVLADDMNVRRPKRWGVRLCLEADRASGRVVAECRRNAGVVAQRVEPNVRHVFLVERQRDAPLESRLGPRDTQILKRVVFQEAKHLVAARRWLDEIGVGLNMVDKPLLMFAELEVVIVLNQLGDLTVKRIERAVLAPVFLRQKRLLPRRVKPAILRLIKMSGVVKLL